MKNEFVPYEEALALKELGFDYCCFCSYTSEGKLADSYGTYYKTYPSDVVIAPTFSQAFRWFREKYDIQSYIKPLSDKTWSVYIDRWGHHIVPDYMIFNTYKEAELACLRKLIEIVNQNKDE